MLELKLHGLQVLNLTSYKFSILPPTSSQSYLLQVLNLTSYKFSILPPTSSQSYLLQVLDLTSYKFSILPPTSSQSYLLQVLNLTSYFSIYLLQDVANGLSFGRLQVLQLHTLGGDAVLVLKDMLYLSIARRGAWWVTYVLKEIMK